MGRKFKPVPVIVDGAQVGSLRLRYRTWQFRFRVNGIPLETTLRGVRDTREALRRAEIEFERQKSTAPQALPAVGRKPRMIADAIEIYEDAYRKEFKKSSADRAMPNVRLFGTIVGLARPTYVVMRDHLQALRTALLERLDKGEIAAATANITLKSVKAFVNWMRGEGLVDGNPTFKVKRFKIHTVARRAPSPEEVSALVERLNGHWLEDYVLLLANAGLRPSEGLHCRTCDFDQGRQILTIQAWRDERTNWTVKDYEYRKLLMNGAAYEAALRRVRMTSGPQALLFPNSEGRPFDYHNFRNQVWQPVASGFGVSPYSLRHYFATQAVLSGWPPEKLRRYLGHQDVVTTLQYYADSSAITEVGAPPETTPRYERERRS